MPRVHFVKKARKDNSAVKAGESYYWWKFRFGGMRRSATYPKRSQLTQSPFLSELYDLEDTFQSEVGAAETTEDFETVVQDTIGGIEQLRDQCQESLDNMPEHLQDSSDSGVMLAERIEALESWENDLESVDVEIEDGLDEDELEERITEIRDELISAEYQG